MSTRSKTPRERFEHYITKTDSCWLWTGPCNQKDYGQLYLGRDANTGSQRHVVAHRWAFEQDRGRAVREGKVLDHTCFNRKCVNPGHLREVSNQFNTFRRKGPNPNSSTGVRNVYKMSDANKGYFVRVKFDGKAHYGGTFATVEQAASCADDLRARLWSAKYGDVA